MEFRAGKVTDYLLVKETQEVRAEKERFKLHLKADWKFTWKTIRRDAFQTEGPLCKQRQ